MKIFWAVIAAGVLMAGSAQSEDFVGAMNLPKAGVIHQTIARSRVETDKPASPVVTFKYRLEYKPAGDGVIVEQIPEAADSPGLSAAEKAVVMQALGGSRLAYEADETFQPLAVRDWPATVERMMSAIRSQMPQGSADLDAAVAATRATYAGMNAETAASTVLVEQNLVAMGQGHALDLNKPMVQKQDMGVAEGKPAFQTVTVKLVAIDKKAGRATISIKEALDKDSAGRLARDALRPMMASMGQNPAARAELEKLLPQMSMERTTDCTYLIDMKSGLSEETKCTRTVSAFDPQAGKDMSRADSWTITQNLAAK